ncbi:MAG: Ig-like domain-containing protein [Candidatus Hodarchaeales archaeon]
MVFNKNSPILSSLGVFILITSFIGLIILSSAGASLTHENTTLQSKWTWDEPQLDGTFENIWNYAIEYSYSVNDVWDDYSSQRVSLRFLNTEEYLFIGVQWIDEDPYQSDYIYFYFDEFHDGFLNDSMEDYKGIVRSLSSWSAYDGHYNSSTGWSGDTNQTYWIGYSSTSFEVKIPIGTTAESYDLDSTSAGDIIGLHLGVQDGELVYNPNPSMYTIPTEIFGTNSDPTGWADLQLSSKPFLDFQIDLNPSSQILEVGEVFYLTTFISNNNGTEIIYNLNATLVLSEGITYAPTESNFKYLESLNSASLHSSGYNHTFLWTLVANYSGIHTINLLLDGTKLPELSSSINITVTSSFPLIHVKGSSEDLQSDLLFFYFEIFSLEPLLFTQYSLDDMYSWINLVYNGTTGSYSAQISEQLKIADFFVRAINELNKSTVLKVLVENQTAIITEITVYVDNSPPLIQVMNPLNNTAVNGVVTIQLNVTDDTGVSTVECQMNNGLWLTMVQNSESLLYEYSWDTTLVEDGVHTLLFQTKDVLNNAYQIISLKVEVMNPTISSLDSTSMTQLSGQTSITNTIPQATSLQLWVLLIGITILVVRKRTQSKKSE